MTVVYDKHWRDNNKVMKKPVVRGKATARETNHMHLFPKWRSSDTNTDKSVSQQSYSTRHMAATATDQYLQKNSIDSKGDFSKGHLLDFH